MRGEKLLEKFGLIDEKYIEEAEEKTKRKNIKIPVLIAACFIFVLLVAALPFFKKETPPDLHETYNAVDTTERPEITYTPPQIYDGIPYSSLDIGDTEYEPGISDIPGGSADTVLFEERYLDGIEAVIEGRVMDVKIKNYEIITDFDKFDEGARTHFIEYSVVYEMEVEKVYKGNLTKEGDIFVIEDRVIAPRNTFFLKEGHSYVIPITETDEHWGSWQGNIVEGSTERDSMYYNPYRYHPQIERTGDGYYLFPNVWTTLAASDGAVKVTMDIPYDTDRAYFNDKMMLLDSLSFEKKMNEIIEKYN